MKILIIGGTQFIGPYVVKLLNEKGHQIYLFNRGKTQYSFPFTVQQIIGDRAKLSTYKKELQSLQPDVVIDMISYSENDAQQLAETFHGKVNRIVLISSCDVYHAFDRLWKVITGDLIHLPLNENAPLRKNFYPNHDLPQYEKILVEKTICSYSDIQYTILRLPMVYGPGDYWRIEPYLKQMDDDKPIMIDEQKANWRFTRGYVEDIAHAIVLAAVDTRQGNKIYNVGERRAYSEIEWIKQIGHYADWHNQMIKVPLIELPQSLQEPGLEFRQDFILDTELIRAELNYQEVCGHEEAMKKSIEWLRKMRDGA